MFEAVKNIYLNNNGMTDGTGKTEIYMDMYRQMKSDDRLSAGYTLRQYHLAYTQAFVSAIKAVDPTWEYGKAVPSGALDSVTRESAESQMVGPNAPQEMKDAWTEAAKEVNTNGMGIRGNGMMSHISQMMVQRLNKQLKGETENFDILGSTVESAIQATKEALYDLEHPRVYTPRSIEVQQARIKEGEFYRVFLEKLEQL